MAGAPAGPCCPASCALSASQLLRSACSLSAVSCGQQQHQHAVSTDLQGAGYHSRTGCRSHRMPASSTGGHVRPAQECCAAKPHCSPCVPLALLVAVLSAPAGWLVAAPVQIDGCPACTKCIFTHSNMVPSAHHQPSAHHSGAASTQLDIQSMLRCAMSQASDACVTHGWEVGKGPDLTVLAVLQPAHPATAGSAAPAVQSCCLHPPWI